MLESLGPNFHKIYFYFNLKILSLCNQHMSVLQVPSPFLKNSQIVFENTRGCIRRLYVTKCLALIHEKYDVRPCSSHSYGFSKYFHICRNFQEFNQTDSIDQDLYAQCSEMQRTHNEMAIITICKDVKGKNIVDIKK